MFTLELLTQSAWAERIGWVLVHSLWQFVLVAFLAVGLKWTLARRSAAIRYWTLLAVMFVMVAAPVATWFSTWSSDAPAPAVEYRAVEMPDSILTTQPVSPLELRDDATAARVARPERSDGRGESPGDAATPFAEPQGRATQGAASGLAWSLPLVLVENHIRPWLPQIVLVWFAGVLLAAFRPLLSWHTVRRLKTKGVSPVAGAVRCVLDRTAKTLRVARAVELLQSALVKTPVVVGCFRPAILLPLCVVTGLPEAQLELILAHELAHIRRHDYLINLLQTLIETLFFYHPAVWWLSRQIRNERENCCDDVAMATVGNRADYGRALLAIEELRGQSTALSVAAGGGSLLARIRRIAGCEPAPRFAGTGSVLCVILLSLGMYLATTVHVAVPGEKPEQSRAAGTPQATEEASGMEQRPSLDKPAPKEVWFLTVQDAIRCALHNSRVMRQIGVQVVGLPKPSTSDTAAGASTKNPTEAIPGGNERVFLARRNMDISLLDVETAVRNLVSEVEKAYWELYFGYRKLDVAEKYRDRAFATWQEILTLYLAKAKGGEAASEAQAGEQHLLFRTTAEQALSQVSRAERNLRSLMGVAATDSRLIRPVDDPATAKTRLDWPQVLNEALRRSPEIRKARWLLKQRELELTAAKNYAPSHGDEQKDNLRNAELSLAREKAGLHEVELEIARQMADAARDVELTLLLAQRAFHRQSAAQRESDAVTTAYKARTITLNALLDARRRDADAESSYYRAAVDYVQCVATLHRRKGSLLEYHGVYLTEDSEDQESSREIARRASRPERSDGRGESPGNAATPARKNEVATKPDQAARKKDGGFAVEGTVTSADGRPSAGATVGIYDAAQFPGSVFPRTKTDGNGRYRFNVDEPSEYIVAAVAESSVPAWRRITVDKNRQAIDLQLSKGQPIRVRVVDQEGKPMPGVRINFAIAASDKNAGLIILDYERDLQKWRKRTDAEGRWSTKWIPDDKIRLTTEREGYLREEVMLAPNEIEKEITLEPCVGVSGRVVDKKTGARVHVAGGNAKAIAGAKVHSGADAVTSAKAANRDGGGFHLVRGNTTWIGSEGPPLVYDDYDKHFYMSRGAHTVVLPKHMEGFYDFYGQRTLDRGVGRMDVHRVQWRSGQPANIVIRGAIDLPAYQLLLQPSAQRALNLSDEQRTRLQDISAKYWPERRKIAGKELDDMEAAAQRELAAEDAKAGREGCVRSGTGPVGGKNSPFSKDIVGRLEQQWTSARKQIEDVLTPEQLRTLKDLTFRTFAFGSGVMFEPEVLERLGADKTQQDKLRVLELELQKEKDRRLRKVPREKITKMFAVLTPQQLSQLREQHSPDKSPDTDCSMYPYPSLPSHMPDSGAAEELGFSAEQRQRVRKIVTAHWNSLIALDQEKKKLPLADEKGRKAIDEKRRQELADLRKKIEAALTPEQWASCKEMAFENLAIPWLRMASGMAQVPGGMGLTDRLRMGAGMALAFGGMGLTGEQMAALRKIDAEHSDKPEQIYRELTDKALAAFTPAQRERLRAEVDRRGW